LDTILLLTIQFGYVGVKYMTYMIRELRNSTGMTQKEFAQIYGIPLSTLRKWEQGEATPAPYVLNLLARTLPSTESSLWQIDGGDGIVYYYDTYKKTVSDMRGNIIMVQDDLREIKKQNLILYLQELFENFYEIQEKFNRDCTFDKEEDILWSR
jgi:transcriptional regulator with XRE-family HTH domain